MANRPKVDGDVVNAQASAFDANAKADRRGPLGGHIKDKPLGPGTTRGEAKLIGNRDGIVIFIALAVDMVEPLVKHDIEHKGRHRFGSRIDNRLPGITAI